jgi:hypothetical protein
MKPDMIRIIVVCVSLGLFAAASWWKTAPVVNLKDLNENMVDIRIYQAELWQTSLMNIGNYQNHFLTSIIKSSKRQSAN